MKLAGSVHSEASSIYVIWVLVWSVSFVFLTGGDLFVNFDLTVDCLVPAYALAVELWGLGDARLFLLLMSSWRFFEAILGLAVEIAAVYCLQTAVPLKELVFAFSLPALTRDGRAGCCLINRAWCFVWTLDCGFFDSMMTSGFFRFIREDVDPDGLWLVETLLVLTKVIVWPDWGLEG